MANPAWCKAVHHRYAMMGAAKILPVTVEQDKWLLKQNSAYEFALVNA